MSIVAKSVGSSPASCRSSRNSMMSRIRVPTSSSFSSLTPMISCGLVLEHAGARAGRGDDRQVLAGRCAGRRTASGRTPSPASNRPLDCWARPQQPCLGTMHLVAEVLQHLDRLLGGLHLEVAARAAVEEHQRARGSGPSSASDACGNQPSKVWLCGGGIGASRCTFDDRFHRSPGSACCAARRWRSAPPASSSSPISVVWPISWSRSGMWSAFMTARAWLFSSAIWTPCGQTSVQVPQLEQ